MHVKLRKLREDRKVSQEEMGRFLSISQPQYQRKEAGYASFTEKECSALAAYFDVTLESIFDSNTLASQSNIGGRSVSTLYHFTDRLMEEIMDMLYYLKQELGQKKEENLQLREQLDKLQEKLNERNDGK